MKQWNKLGVAVAAVVLAVALGGGAYAMWGGDDGGGTEAGRDAGQNGVEAICIEGAEDCDDTVGDVAERCLPEATDCDDTIGGAAGTCPEGTVDCVDADLGGAAGGTCLAGTEDCVDADLGGGSLGMCAPGVTDCVDVVVGESADCAPDQQCDNKPDVLCDDGGAGGCESVECPEPAADITLTPEEIERMQAACDANAQPTCDDTASGAQRCLPPDCAVSSDGEIACPEDDPGSEGEGTSSSGGSDEPQVDPVPAE